jgi:hypothetical protein
MVGIVELTAPLRPEEPGRELAEFSGIPLGPFITNSPSGNSRVIHSISGRHAGHDSVSIGGKVIAAISIASSSHARASLRLSSSQTTSAPSAMLWYSAIMSARDSDITKASLTSPPRLWSMKTTKVSS